MPYPKQVIPASDKIIKVSTFIDDRREEVIYEKEPCILYTDGSDGRQGTNYTLGNYGKIINNKFYATGENGYSRELSNFSFQEYLEWLESENSPILEEEKFGQLTSWLTFQGFREDAMLTSRGQYRRVSYFVAIRYEVTKQFVTINTYQYIYKITKLSIPMVNSYVIVNPVDLNIFTFAEGTGGGYVYRMKFPKDSKEIYNKDGLFTITSNAPLDGVVIFLTSSNSTSFDEVEMYDYETLRYDDTCTYLTIGTI